MSRATPSAARPRALTVDVSAVRRAIGERKLGDWVITDRARRHVELSAVSGRSRWRSDACDDLQVLVRRDLPSGRGTGVASTQERGGDPRLLIGQAVARAEAAIEPSWSTPPAAAAAKVELFDDAAPSAEEAAEALGLALHSAAAGAGAKIAAMRVSVTRDTLALVSAQGFELSWQESRLELWAQIERDGQRRTLRRQARRISELELPSALTSIVAELSSRGAVVPAPRGPVVLELSTSAMLGDDELGVWRALTSQCDAVAERRGLTRHRHGALIGHAESPLEVWSDGVLPFGLRSAPVGAEGEAVRRFPLLMRGALGELGMGPQEAAMRRRSPNGGVRNLVVNAGNGDGRTTAVAGAPVLAVSRLAFLQIDPLTGRAEGELGHATTPEGKVVTAGSFALDLVAALATATRSPELVRRGAYAGPRWLRLGPLTLTT